MLKRRLDKARVMEHHLYFCLSQEERQVSGRMGQVTFTVSTGHQNRGVPSMVR